MSSPKKDRLANRRHTYENLVAATTGRGQEWASLAVTATSIGWTPREIEEMLKIMPLKIHG
jgi:hypothetical protein